MHNILPLFSIEYIHGYKIPSKCTWRFLGVLYYALYHTINDTIYALAKRLVFSQDRGSTSS